MSMTTKQVGEQLVALCRAGKATEAHETLYAAAIVSVEASAPPGQSPESRGAEAVAAKSAWWQANHEIHGAKVEGPWPHGDRFIVRFEYDVTFKPEAKRFTMIEAALYEVQDGKIVREEFFYST
jgi:hypothetical protein